MVLLVSFLIGIQVLHSVAASAPTHFLTPSCNDLVVQDAAATALDKLNADRKEGYILSLQRIFDVHKLPQKTGGTIFYLILDVLETDCHVLSMKLWKECKIRDAHETVYGQCKAVIYFDRSFKYSHLYNYDCVLRPISKSAVLKICPDCPTAGDPSEATYQETAAESLAKFNAESNHIHYFAILNVTKASYQWVVGPSNFVEYTIQETSCRRSQLVPDVTKCPLLPFETAEKGLCKGSVIDSQIENRKFVTANCKFFSQSVPEEQTPQSTSEPGQAEPHEEGESHRDHHHHHHRRPHHHKHHGHKHERQGPPLHNSTAADIIQSFPDQKETVGRVLVFPPLNSHVSLHSLPEVQAERLDGKSSPTEVQEPNQERNAHSAKPARSTIPPFPSGFSQSSECPGESAVTIPGLELPIKKNASLIYLTLDVLETQCPVISRKHWSSCGHRRVLKITDLGQCKAVVYINKLAKEEKLCAYNCTITPVPPQLYECKRCLEKTTVLEDVDNYREQAYKILEKYTLRSSEANYFKVQKIQKVFGVHIRVLHHRIFIAEFTIKETECARTSLPANVSKCEFLPDGTARLGFCRGQTAKNSGVVEAYNCEIYDAHNGSVYHHHHLVHHFSGEGHPHCNVSGHQWKHTENLKSNHNFSEQSQQEHHNFSSLPGPCFHLPTPDVPHDFPPGQCSPQPVDSVYHIPLLNEHDVLQAPGANFLDHLHGRHKEHLLPDQCRHKKPIIQLFPEVPSVSKSCPGKPRYDFNQTFLSLFPVPSAD